MQGMKDIFKVMKEKNLQPSLLYLAKISFKIDEEIKSFRGKQKLREFSTTKLNWTEISFTTNAKGTSLGRKHKRRKRSTENKPKTIKKMIISSVQFSRSVMSDSLQPHELQHARPPCPSPTPGVHWDSRPSSWWCHPAISSSVVPFSSCPQSFPASGSFPMSQLFAWGGQSTGVSALASVLPKNTQDWSPLGWTGWIT